MHDKALVVSPLVWRIEVCRSSGERSQGHVDISILLGILDNQDFKRHKRKQLRKRQEVATDISLAGKIIEPAKAHYAASRLGLEIGLPKLCVIPRNILLLCITHQA